LDGVVASQRYQWNLGGRDGTPLLITQSDRSPSPTNDSFASKGLGKTLQTIAFLGHLKVRCDTTGPHLIVVPKSTLNNWDREVAKWVPGFNTIVLQGAKEDRVSGSIGDCVATFSGID
jgi:hypothetical protein